MCEVVSIGIGLVSLGMQIYGMTQAEKAGRQTAAQARKNAAAARVAARQSLDEAGFEASRLQMRADQLAANVRVSAASGNTDLSGGNPARLQSDVQVLSKMDQEIVTMRGLQKAAGFITQGDTFSAQAAISQTNAQADMLAGISSAAFNAAKLGQQGYEWWKQQQPPDPGSYYNPEWSSLNAGPD